VKLRLPRRFSRRWTRAARRDHQRWVDTARWTHAWPVPAGKDHSVHLHASFDPDLASKITGVASTNVAPPADPGRNPLQDLRALLGRLNGKQGDS
jgi:hypothetical protein